jgi:hypothetical protein
LLSGGKKKVDAVANTLLLYLFEIVVADGVSACGKDERCLRLILHHCPLSREQMSSAGRITLAFEPMAPAAFADAFHLPREGTLSHRHTALQRAAALGRAESGNLSSIRSAGSQSTPAVAFSERSFV